MKNIEGRAKEALGIVTGNQELENEGTKLRAVGAVEEGVGKARRKVAKVVADVAKAIKP